VSFEELTKFFFEIHDPTQKNGQGPDIGPQYLSAVFTSSDEEKMITQSLVDQLKGKGYDVATKLLPAGTFWKAEEYHQDYYVKKNQQPYCHIYQKKF
jgi:peptide methionine sulfoxide reductase msrA/msrB